MSKATPEQLTLMRAESARATERARKVLKPGDRVQATRCGGGLITVTMTGWDGGWICSATHDDIAASTIVKVMPIRFSPMSTRFRRAS